MKKIGLLIGLIAGMGAVLFAQQLTVAVSTFEARGGLTKDDGDAITDLFISALVSDGTVNVVDRSSFDKIIAEMQFQASDWTDNQKVVELGKMLKATSIIRGSVMTLAGQSAVTTTILDLNSGKLISSSTLSMKEMSEVFSKMPGFVKDLMGNLPGLKVYKVGEFGPAKGIVFYDKGIISNGWRFLEVAPAETEFTAQWGAYNQNVAETQAGIGFGKRNTQLIVERLKQLNENGRAAQLCTNLNFDGFNDWFLPSRDELDLMYKNLKQKGLGGFSNNWYWSSSQGNNIGAWCQYFSDGSQGSGGKNNTYSVRAVRAF